MGAIVLWATLTVFALIGGIVVCVVIGIIWFVSKEVNKVLDKL